MASNLKYITRAISGDGNPADNDRLVREVTTFKVNALYINKTDGSVWIRKAVNGVVADWETMADGGGGGGGIAVADGSDSLTALWVGSQADYNLLTPDPATLYFIKE